MTIYLPPNPFVHYLCGRFPKRLGLLTGPDSADRLAPWLPSILDNGAYGAWKRGAPWNQSRWESWLAKVMAGSCPISFAVVPDSVGNAPVTLDKWSFWAPKLTIAYPGLSLALAMQDGMELIDIDLSAPHVLFLGGTTEWKWRTAEHWIKSHPRVHVGRVNSIEKVYWLEELGCESCDGTGWWKGDIRQTDGLLEYIGGAEFGSELKRLYRMYQHRNGQGCLPLCIEGASA